MLDESWIIVNNFSMTTQVLLKQIEKRAKITRGEKPRVTLPLRDWEMLEDMLLELSSPKLLADVKKAREDYRRGGSVEYKGMK